MFVCVSEQANGQNMTLVGVGADLVPKVRVPVCSNVRLTHASGMIALVPVRTSYDTVQFILDAQTVSQEFVHRITSIRLP